MSTLDTYESKPNSKEKTSVPADLLRDEIMRFTKDFKTSWVELGRALYPVWKDRLYIVWGYEKFEYYTERELGLKKTTAMKMLKSYCFLEQEEPAYLEKEFTESSDAACVPSCDAVNVLRLAKRNRDLNARDYVGLKEAAFQKGKDASALRKDLTALIKERKIVDPEEDRDRRNTAALRRLINALRSFRQDMEALKLAPADLLKQAEELLKKVEDEVD